MKVNGMAIRFALIFLLALSLAGCNAFSPGQPTPLPTVVLDGNAPATQSPLAPLPQRSSVSASGTVTAAQQAQLVMTLAGRIESVAVAEGDRVEAGQALVQLEGQESLQAAISAASFELEQAQQALDALQKDLDVKQAQALKAIADGEDTVRDAQRVVDNINSTAPQVDIDAAYANMILAKDRLDRARDDYKPYEKKAETNTVRAALLSKLAQAQKNYDAAVRTYNNLNGQSSQIDIDQANADLELAKAQLEKAKRDYEILKQGPDPDQVRLAQARVDNAQTQLESAQAALKKLTLTAPFAGTVTTINLHSGEWVNPGQPVLVLADLDHLRIETTDLSERDVPMVELGETVTAQIKALNQEVQGKVTEIAPFADTLGGDVVYRTTIELDTIPDGLRAGMSVDVYYGTGN